MCYSKNVKYKWINDLVRDHINKNTNLKKVYKQLFSENKEF